MYVQQKFFATRTDFDNSFFIGKGEPSDWTHINLVKLYILVYFILFLSSYYFIC